MSPTYADIERTNSNNITLGRRNVISNENIKRIRVHMYVDTCESLLAVSEYSGSFQVIPINLLTF